MRAIHRPMLLILLVATMAAPSWAVERSFALKMSSDDAAKFEQVQKAMEAGDHAKAVELLTPLREAHPSEGDLARLLAHSYFELGRYEEARAAAVEAVSLGRLTTDVLVRLAQIDRDRGDELATLNTVRLITVTNPNDPTWRLLYGDLLMAMDRPAEARAVYERLVEAEPARHDLRTRLGNALIQLDRTDEAALAFETAWSLGERSEGVARILSGLHQQLGDVHAAATWIERTLAAQSKADPALRLRLAQLLFAVRDDGRAREIAEPLVDLSDKDVSGRASLLLGQIAMRADDGDAALTHWRRAHESGVDDPALIRSLGRMSFNRRAYTEAAAYLGEYIELAPGDADACLLAARAAMLADDPASARTLLRTYLQRFGVDDDAADLIAQLARHADTPAPAR